MIQKQFETKNGVMRMTSISKCPFTSLKDKSYYLSDV